MEFLIDFTKTAYQPGEIVSGTLTVRNPTKSDIEAEYLVLGFEGGAEVHWVCSRTKWVRSDSRLYFNFQEDVVRDEVSGKVKIRPGDSSFPFSFQLPQKLPASFKSNHGTVHYIFTASAKLPSGTESIERHIEVTKEYDLDDRPKLLERKEVSDSAPLMTMICPCCCCCCFKLKCMTQRLAIKVRLERTGYCRGETIDVFIEADNKTPVDVKRFDVILCQINLYFAKGEIKTKMDTTEILVTSSSDYLKSNSKAIFVVPLTIPPNISPSRYDCDLIWVEHFLKVKSFSSRSCCRSRCCIKELTVRCPIEIGTLPLTPITKTRTARRTASRKSVSFQTNIPDEDEK